jgi:hypothetical protein
MKVSSAITLSSVLFGSSSFAIAEDGVRGSRSSHSRRHLDPASRELKPDSKNGKRSSVSFLSDCGWRLWITHSPMDL